MLLLLLNQNLKKKKARLQKETKNHSKSCYYYSEGNQHICQYQYEHTKKHNLVIKYKR